MLNIGWSSICVPILIWYILYNRNHEKMFIDAQLLSWFLGSSILNTISHLYQYKLIYITWIQCNAPLLIKYRQKTLYRF